MKTLTLTIIVILMSSTLLYSQDLAGEWSGTLQVQGTQIRIVFHVNKINDNQYEATMDSPDQNASGVKVTTATFSYPNIKFEIANAASVYEGTMSDKSIVGKWVQSGTSLFLALLKKDEFFNENERRK